MQKSILSITSQGFIKNGVTSLSGKVEIKANDERLKRFASLLERELENKFFMILLGNPRFSQTMHFNVVAYFDDISVQKIELIQGDSFDFISLSVLIEDFINTFKL